MRPGAGKGSYGGNGPYLFSVFSVHKADLDGKIFGAVRSLVPQGLTQIQSLFLWEIAALFTDMNKAVASSKLQIQQGTEFIPPTTYRCL